MSNFKKILALGLLGFVAAGVTDTQADENMTWNGFYLGGHVGYGAATFSGLVDTSSTTRPIDMVGSLDPSGAIGGFQAGYNLQKGNWVWGVEGDVTFSDISDNFTASGPDAGAAAGTADRQNADVGYLATLRARAGVTHGNLLYFATAGVAFVDADYTFFDDEALVSGSLNFDDVGIVIGGGVEGAIRSSDWSWRVEGLYYNFDDTKSAATLTPDNDPGDFVKFEDIWNVRFALNYRFGY